ncbi:hypothetical protein [Streptomyces filamentosus]|uniref:hypothetical protein n=1 Tax=Streptomyces filamentosus TaxID=67294 RepID=UPI0033D644BC
MTDTAATPPRRRYADQIRERYERTLGPEVLAHIKTEVAAAPPPSPEVIEELRRIFPRPGGEIPRK